MARRKATTLEQPPTPTLGVKKVRRTEEYTEAVKPEEKQVTIIPAAPPVEEEEEGFYDSIEDTLDELDFEELLMMRVERLPNFRRDGKAGQRNTIKEYVGTIPFSSTFREDIQALYDGGDYRITLLDGQNRYASKEMLKGRKAIYRITIADKPKQQAVINANGQVIMQQAAEAAPQKTFIEQLEEYAKISKSLAAIANPNGAHQVVATAEPKAPVVPIEEKVTSLILDKILESKDESLTDKFISKYLGEDKEPQFSWGEVAREIIQPLVPVAIQLATALMAPRQAETPIAQQQPGAPTQAQLPPATEPAALPMEVSDTDKLLAIIREGCLNSVPVERVAGAVDWLTSEENSEQMARFWMLGTHGILRFLRLPETVEHIGWMNALVTELQGEDDSEEPTTEVIQ